MVKIAVFLCLVVSILAPVANAIPNINNHGDETLLNARQPSSPKLVFAHFMMGIIGDRQSAADYDQDMLLAKGAGIDAFALNIGTDASNDRQLGFAYQSAANNGMKVFISFDFNYWSKADTAVAQRIGQMIAQYGSSPGQLKIGSKIFASSFVGDGFNTDVMRSSAAGAGVEVYWVPNFHPGQGDVGKVDGAFNWMGWDNNGNNKAPSGTNNVTVAQGDQQYKSWLGGKPYMAPVSPWFSTHFGAEVSYSKNWVFPGDLLWYNRWNEILTLKPEYAEIISWNDYGESHYVGPLSSKHNDDGASKWVNDMPHNAWLEMAKPYIAAYKVGASSVNSYITSDKLIYWYRPTSRDVNCDATDTTMTPPADNVNYFNGKPNGWETLTDNVFVVALLTSPGSVSITSGVNTQTFNAPAGATAFKVTLGVGPQKFTLSRNEATVLSGTSLKDVSSSCVCGIYNFNAFVGSLPAGSADPLGADGLARFTSGLKASCAAMPSLGTAPAASSTSTVLSSTTSTSVVTSPPTTTPATTTTRPPTPSTTSGSVCVQGNLAPGQSGNYIGLCQFSCQYGYCPPGPCTCSAYGVQKAIPPGNGRNGCPAPGLDSSYSGLCSFSCNHDYCPSGACVFC